MKGSRCIVLLSGGIDSATALWLNSRHAKGVISLSIIFHRRNVREIESARRLAMKANVEQHIECDASFLKEVFDLDENIRNRAISRNVPTTFIPFRNAIFYSIASYFAYLNDCDRIVVGHNREDVVLFPDVSREYIEAYNSLLSKGSLDAEIRIEAPLINYTKREVFGLAIELGVPLEDTWSCWGTGEFHCGTCPGCMNRKQLFAAFGLNDVTRYLDGS